MHKVWKHILIISPILIIISFLGFILFYPVPHPPVKEMEAARNALSDASRNRAEKYSQDFYDNARNLYDSAMKYWQLENSKFVYKRDYSKSITFAILSAQKAGIASKDSDENSSDLKSRIRNRIDSIRKTDSLLVRRFSKYPLGQERRKNISRGGILLSEAEFDWQNGNFPDADRKSSEAEQLLLPAYDYADRHLKDYFRSFPVWRVWIDSTINESRLNQDFSIIVDKFSRKLIVYNSGEKQLEYSAELGKNWVGDKRVRGDNATPEGIYKITRMFRSDSTKYYKALLLDYPNDEDTAIFESMKNRGQIPRNAKIGGMIEIHGNGGKGSDWTEGCIALTDREMDSLFRYVKIGTPVTIVGSMYDLRTVLKRLN